VALWPRDQMLVCSRDPNLSYYSPELWRFVANTPFGPAIKPPRAQITGGSYFANALSTTCST
jgi:hypothetical protein